MLHLISNRAHARTVTRTAEILGIPLPTDYLEQVAEIEALTAAVGQITVTTEQLHKAVLDAIENGVDYSTDKTVQRLALDRSLTAGNIGAAARARSDQMLAKALTDWADEILEDWADALEPQSAALVAAADAGLSNLTETAGVVAKGGDNMGKLHQAQSAMNAWTAAVNGFCSLAVVSSVHCTGNVSVAIETPASLADLKPAFTLAQNERVDVDAWTLARCGIPLRLATLAQFMCRAAQFNADCQSEDSAEDERRKERVVSSW